MQANQKLTPHFTLAELIHSTTAQRRGIDNSPTADDLKRLQTTAEMLERIRSTLGVPVTVTSCYRSEALNKAVRGVPGSDHTRGQAADFVAPMFGSPYKIAKTLAPLAQTLGIGQLIYECIGGKQWVHVSTKAPEKAINRIITVFDGGVRVGVMEVA